MASPSSLTQQRSSPREDVGLSESTNESARFFGGAGRTASDSGILDGAGALGSIGLFGIDVQRVLLVQVHVDRQKRALEGVGRFQSDAKHNVVVGPVLQRRNSHQRYLKVDRTVGRLGRRVVRVRAGRAHGAAVHGELERGGGGAVLVEYLDGPAAALVEGGGGVDFVPVGTDGELGPGWWALLLELAALVVVEQVY